MGCRRLWVPTWTHHASKDNHEPKARSAPAARFGVFFIKALRCFEQKLNFDSFEWKDDATTFGAIKNACIQQGRDV